MTMDGAIVSSGYRDARLRLTDLVAAAPEAQWSAVPACPGWSVHDVVGHLVGIIEDGAAGRIQGIPSPEQTEEQVTRHRDDTTAALLATWSVLGPFFEAKLLEKPRWPALIDVLSHEHDVRHSLDRPGASDVPVLATVVDRMIAEMSLPVPLRIAFGSGEARDVGPPTGAPGQPALTLTTTPFEFFRIRLGRLQPCPAPTARLAR